ncbi:MAG: hypothetical protein IJ513_10075, partial [Bacteroidaceae bacterium]|nr:hypothetical protein [Bacteroidaceae bacterium]
LNAKNSGGPALHNKQYIFILAPQRYAELTIDHKQGEQLWCFALNNLGEHIGSPLLIKQYTLHTKH